MLWYKSWLETRWRFVIGLVVLLLSACSSVWAYPQILKLLPQVPTGLDGPIGRAVSEAATLARDYRGYVWSQWFRQNMSEQWTLFAVLLGSGGLLSQATSGGGLFTLSLPVTRARLLGVRAAVGLTELLILAVSPALLITLISPAIGHDYAVTDAVAHGLCMFVAGSVFFSLAFLLSTIFNDAWRPVLIVFGIGVVIGLAEQFAALPFGLFRVMSGEGYFRTGQLPYVGLLVTAAASGVLIYAATRNIARQDF